MSYKKFWLTELKDYDQWSAHDHEQYDDDIEVIDIKALRDAVELLKRGFDVKGGDELMQLDKDIHEFLQRIEDI
jgi:hypothetical protein